MMPDYNVKSHAERILVIEDNHDAAEILRTQLEGPGHTVEVVYSGEAGLEAARRFRPDVVFCDIVLPGMDGYMIASTLRRDPVTGDAYLIALTGYPQEEDWLRCREAGFDLHLTKPIAPSELATVIASLERAEKSS